MTRSEAYSTITRFIKSGLFSGETVQALKEVRSLICSGDKDVVNHEGMELLWLAMRNRFIDESVRERVYGIFQCCYNGFESCNSGISPSQCGDCPYNKHFTWGD